MSPDKPVFGDDGSDFLIISIPRPLLSLDGGWVCGVEAAFALPGWSLGPHGDAWNYMPDAGPALAAAALRPLASLAAWPPRVLLASVPDVCD